MTGFISRQTAQPFRPPNLHNQITAVWEIENFPILSAWTSHKRPLYDERPLWDNNWRDCWEVAVGMLSCVAYLFSMKSFINYHCLYQYTMASQSSTQWVLDVGPDGEVDESLMEFIEDIEHDDSDGDDGDDGDNEELHLNRAVDLADKTLEKDTKKQYAGRVKGFDATTMARSSIWLQRLSRMF